MPPGREPSPDHGLLAICLHANGASVIAGDRAAGPLDVARENVRLYLRHAQEDLHSAVAAAVTEGPPPRIRGRNIGHLDADAEVSGRPDQGDVGEGVGEGKLAAEVDPPRLECRLGDGLAVLEDGEVDTVCIAGVGAYFALLEQACVGCVCLAFARVQAWGAFASVLSLLSRKNSPPNWRIAQRSCCHSPLFHSVPFGRNQDAPLL